MRLVRTPLLVLTAAAVTAALALVPLTPVASAATGSSIASLANANVGKKACSVNSLGGRYFGPSCTGDGGLPEYWCADFAKWVWAHEGVADTSWLTPAAGSFYTYGLHFGTLSATPAVGDAAVFNYYGSGVAQHVAIVTEVHANGTIETVSGDWGGSGSTEPGFASTSSVVANQPVYQGYVGARPATMGMVLSAFVKPVGVPVAPLVGSAHLWPGQQLAKGQGLSAPDGLFRLAMTETGNLVEYAGGRKVWSTGTAARNGDRAVMQRDGNLVVYDTSGKPVWSSGTGGHPGSKLALALSNDGRIAVVRGIRALWWRHPSSGSVAGGTTLSHGQQLVSPNGLYRLVMQRDGNLVEYTANRPLWSTRTNGHYDGRAVMQRASNLVVYPATGRAVWSSGRARSTAGYTLTLESSAELVISGPSGTVWSRRP